MATFSNPHFQNRHSHLINIPLLKNNKNFLCLTFLLINAQSLSKKHMLISDLLQENNPDFFAITESWLKNTDQVILNHLNHNDYDTFSIPRNYKRGGGLLLIIRKHFSMKIIPHNLPKQFEVTLFDSQHLQICLVYCPPKLLDNNISPLIEFLISNINTKKPVIILGDFNLHTDANPRSSSCETLLDMLSSLNFILQVNNPTHKAGHTLDLIFTNNFMNSSISHNPVPWSDHHLLLCKSQTNFNNPTNNNSSKKSFKFRPPYQINLLLQELGLQLANLDLSNINNAIQSWSSITETTANNINPEKIKHLKNKKEIQNPWFNTTLKNMKSALRKTEKEWQKNKLPATLQKYRSQLAAYKKSIQNTKRNYFGNKIINSSNKPKSLFNFVNNLISDIHISNASITKKKPKPRFSHLL
ncbi:uncharacterized protein LOC115079905 [Rhinatrema bivittatum]|uniref:uncharacterized protein LOC115079905 n=1 Tax=Rhinatrema bivittatum TaxID=194408 RepID=UPI00112CDA08|nr:uncharacterized protein LOC115079905 [Rhinatrema bivittatum]